MPIANYSTSIAVDKTMGEIQGMLGARGAESILIEYRNGHPDSMSFAVTFKDIQMQFRLPSKWRGVLAILEDDHQVTPKLKCEVQARRVAWRIMKDWIRAQMAMVDAGAAELVEVFIPYAVMVNGGTLFEQLMANPGQLLLTAGDLEEAQ